jgi:ubiquinone/menaquinone biosynthesis C-methylase UbiE
MKDSPWRQPNLARLTFGEVHNLVDEYVFGQSLRILDVGCGRGWLSLELAREGHDVIGIDSSKEMIRSAKKTMDSDPYKNERGKLEFQVSDLSQWEHPLETFDLVIFSRSLHHIPRPDKAVRKAHDLLRKNGQIICIEYAYDRVDKRTATWIYQVRRSLQQSGWYKSRKKLSENTDQSVRKIMEEYRAPPRREHFNRFEEMRKPLNTLFREAHFSWEPYIYWDLIMDMRIPSTDVEMATAQSIMSMESALIEAETISPVLFCFVGLKQPGKS